MDERPYTLTQLNSANRAQCPFSHWVIGCGICMRSKCKLYKGTVHTKPYKSIECYNPQYLNHRADWKAK